MANNRRLQMTEIKSLLFLSFLNFCTPPIPDSTGSQKPFLHSVAVDFEIRETDIGCLTVEKKRACLHAVEA